MWRNGVSEANFGNDIIFLTSSWRGQEENCFVSAQKGITKVLRKIFLCGDCCFCEVFRDAKITRIRTCIGNLASLTKKESTITKETMIEQGATVFFQCPKNSWILGTVETWDEAGGVGACLARKPEDGRDVVKGLKDSQIFVARDDIISEDVDDLLNLTVLHDATLLNCLKLRYFRDVIYTNIGAIVVAVNPFNYNIPWYKDEKMVDYLAEGDVIEKNLPHSWAVAHNTYFELRNDGHNQSIIVSGESGAGKTEASKIVMKYLAAVSSKTGSEETKNAGKLIGQKINLTSLPLECFGNAKTVRNDNSSRFGKFMAVQFSADGILRGACITKYLLEKSRIVVAANNERCYHGLYLVTRGKDAGTFRAGKDSNFSVLTSGKCLHNKEFDTAEHYDQVTDAMKTIGMADEEIRSLWSVVAAVLHLGNVQFQPDGEGSAILASCSESVESVVSLLSIDSSCLEKELLTTTLIVAGQEVVKLLNPVAATDAKEALMKALYDCMFQWVVEKCNSILNAGDKGDVACWIGLLDIFGFEDFEVNSFEQLCINLTNETLQNHYNAYIFTKDLEECRSEGIDMSSVEFPDNAPCLSLITGKGGILVLLDEECSLGKGSDDNFLSKISESCGSNSFFLRKVLQKTSFTIHHYAGDVTYEVVGFLDKNRDTLKDAFKLIMRKSADNFVAGLLPEPNDARRTTVGGFFKNQLKELMEVLNSTNPHWIRCIKPHPDKKPRLWHGVSIMHQLSSSGVLGTVKIRKAGFPVRIKRADFEARYSILGRDIASILSDAQIPTQLAQTGKCRVFLKTEAYIKLEQRKKTALLRHAQTVQAFARSWAEFIRIKKMKRQTSAALVEKLRSVARRLLDLQSEEASARTDAIAKYQKAKDELRNRRDETAKEMVKEWRRLQVERLRKQYEEREREERLQAEKARKERVRQELREKKLKEQREQHAELEALQKKAQEARKLREERELAEALAGKEALQRHLRQKADVLFERRLSKREEEKAKAGAAKQRRTALTQGTFDTLSSLAQETAKKQTKGDMLKARRLFELKQEREEAWLKNEVRRSEVEERLQDEADKRERYLLMQLAVADARHSFQAECKRRIERDNSFKQHTSHIEEKLYHDEVDRMREKCVKKEHEELQRTRCELDKMNTTIKTFAHRSETAKMAADKLLEPFIKSDDHQRKQSHYAHLDTVRRDLAKLGEAVYEGYDESAQGLAVQEHIIEKSVPQHIDPQLYDRLGGNERVPIIQKYATATTPTRPPFSLPWRR